MNEESFVQKSPKNSQKWTIRTDAFNKAGGYNQPIELGASLYTDNKQEINKTTLVITVCGMLKN